MLPRSLGRILSAGRIGDVANSEGAVSGVGGQPVTYGGYEPVLALSSVDAGTLTSGAAAELDRTGLTRSDLAVANPVNVSMWAGWSLG